LRSRSARADRAAVQSAPSLPSLAAPSVRARLAHQALDELGRKAAPEQEARLRRSLGRASGQGGETARANGGSAVDLGRGERRRELGRQLDRMLRELAADALNAEALGARMHARLGEARVGEKAIRFEPVEQRVDLGRDGARVGVGVGSRIAFSAPRVAQELPAQLEPALIALREQLQGARLERSLRLHLESLSP
jgi:hypothetical protein